MGLGGCQLLGLSRTFHLLHGGGIRILAGGRAIRRIVGIVSCVILILVIGRNVHIIHHHAGLVTAHGRYILLLPLQGFQRQLAGLDNHKSHIHLAYNDGGVTDPQNGRGIHQHNVKTLLHFLQQFIKLAGIQGA